MKKFIVFVGCLCILLLFFIYIFIPAKLEVSKIEVVKCNINGAYRTLENERSWIKWWPEKDSLKSDFVENIFFYKGDTFRIANRFYNSFQIDVTSKNSSQKTNLNLIKINVDSTAVVWTTQLQAGVNPIKRVVNYNAAVKIRENMSRILSHLHLFLQDKENVYRFDFHRSMSKDSTLVAIKKTTSQIPSTAEIYELIANLKEYIIRNEAKENNFPMLNVRKISDTNFETMVAIPINKALKGNGLIFFSRFVPWYVLTAEVRGGDKTVNEALDQMSLYITDYGKTQMAIPFQSLVTDRMTEPDTLKWVTNIYTPVPF